MPVACTSPLSLASFVQREVARLAVTEGLFFLAFPQVQSLSRKATAPFTQGSLDAEPVGSSNYLTLALVALPPQMWQPVTPAFLGGEGVSRRLTDEVS